MDLFAKIMNRLQTKPLKKERELFKKVSFDKIESANPLLLPAFLNAKLPFLFQKSSVVLDKSVVSEKQRNAPDCGNCHKNVNDAAYDRRRAAERPRNKVELENADKPPVDPADYE